LVVSSKSIVLTIVAIVGLALLFKAFYTNDGADKLEQTMKGVSAVIDILRDRV
jgi:type II secretory pathway pseudopilin PulG